MKSQSLGNRCKLISNKDKTIEHCSKCFFVKLESNQTLCDGLSFSGWHFTIIHMKEKRNKSLKTL